MSTETKPERKKLQAEAYNLQFPKNTILQFRCREATNEVSKASNTRQHKLVLEVINAEPFEVDGNPIDINGLEFYNWSTLTVKALPFANRVRAAFGFNDLKEEDISSADAREFIGQTAYAFVESSEEDRINEITKQPVKDPYTGENMKVYQRKITEWVAKPKDQS